MSTWLRYNWAGMIGIVGKSGRLGGRYIWDVGEWEERVVWYVGVLEKGREMGGLNSWPRIGWFFTVRPR